jgi:hypothetical protein
MKTIKKLFFFWICSFIIAIAGYYLLWLIMPNHFVFGVWFRMFLYHYEFPIQYIVIPSFFYGIIASIFSSRFNIQSIKKQLLTLFYIVSITMIISFPFGGMLWMYHDMQAGYFPTNWVEKMIRHGIASGLSTGWLIISLSLPYNLLGVVVAYFLTKKGAQIFD